MVVEERSPPPASEGKLLDLIKLPFRNYDFHNYQTNNNNNKNEIEGYSSSSSSVSSVARSLIPPIDYFFLVSLILILHIMHEPGKQVRSAIRIKNRSKSHVAFKFQTTAPKSCFMRPPGAILAPGESIIATGEYSGFCYGFIFHVSHPVFKFVEPPENNEKLTDQKSKVKFKIMSLKVKGQMDYQTELFDEQKDQVAVEQILRVVFLDVERPSTISRDPNNCFDVLSSGSPLCDAIALQCELCSINKERRERYLARQQTDGVDSV
ncbi:membrane trafficking regulatory protein [Lithospermum erythrorhizon]|uniref:Membrane trafficking regulatory protein n=1 Tax=Lithospermum erythrorhizon TaxID=34254 RepID=A0AAV3PMF1_LITER